MICTMFYDSFSFSFLFSSSSLIAIYGDAFSRFFLFWPLFLFHPYLTSSFYTIVRSSLPTNLVTHPRVFLSLLLHYPPASHAVKITFIFILYISFLFFLQLPHKRITVNNNNNNNNIKKQKKGKAGKNRRHGYLSPIDEPLSPRPNYFVCSDTHPIVHFVCVPCGLHIYSLSFPPLSFPFFYLLFIFASLCLALPSELISTALLFGAASVFFSFLVHFSSALFVLYNVGELMFLLVIDLFLSHSPLHRFFFLA